MVIGSSSTRRLQERTAEQCAEAARARRSPASGRSPCQPCRPRTERVRHRRADARIPRSPPTRAAGRSRRPRLALRAAGSTDTIAGSSTVSGRPARSRGRRNSRRPQQSAIRAARRDRREAAPNTTPAAIASTSSGISARLARTNAPTPIQSVDEQVRHGGEQRPGRPGTPAARRTPTMSQRWRARCTIAGIQKRSGLRPARRVDRRNQLGRPMHRIRSARRDRRRPAAPPSAGLRRRRAARSGPACGRRRPAHRRARRAIPRARSRRRPHRLADPDARRAADRGCAESPPAPARSPPRLHRQIAFGVHAHRPPREVCRPDADQLVVDDHHLRVHEGRHVLRARRRRIDEPQPLVRVSRDQAAGRRRRERRPSCSSRASRGIPAA